MIPDFEYEILKYVINDEPLHILIGAFGERDQVKKLQEAIITLLGRRFIKGLKQKDGHLVEVQLVAADLKEYLKQRLSCKEKLNDFPGCCEEYYFVATDEGIAQLKEEDKPL